jgi:hypothetical protein
MILAALAAAATMAGAPPQILVEPIPPRLQAPPLIERMPNFYSPETNCSDLHRQVVERQKEELKKLGQLPDGAVQYAVARTVGGCGVPAPVGYHPGYLLPGAADRPPAASQPPKP